MREDMKEIARSYEDPHTEADIPGHGELTEALLRVARQYADARFNGEGVASTPINGMFILRETAPSPLQYAITKPLVALVLQGGKRVSMGSRSFTFGAGESLLITMDVPTVSQVTAASAAAPYYSLVMELDAAVITELVGEMGESPILPDIPVRVSRTEEEVAEAALRLLKLLDRPQSLAVLGRQLVRELHYWLLSGRHGGAIRVLGVSDSHSRRIARAVEMIRAGYAQSLRIETLAKVAGMSLSVFHTHFRNITTLTPLQFQKQLRLLEARRRMLAEGAAIGVAAHGVGYESVTQFTREYARMFGQPPARNIREMRTLAQSATP
ncbi:AraC family transcriptional regulator [Achromobacter agilis]|nr:AraC family transcriptional regulator [Achromobacter agilis]